VLWVGVLYGDQGIEFVAPAEQPSALSTTAGGSERPTYRYPAAQRLRRALNSRSTPGPLKSARSPRIVDDHGKSVDLLRAVKLS